MYGINNKYLNDKFINFLISQGCIPAYQYLRDKISRSNEKNWQLKINKIKSNIEYVAQTSISDDPLIRIKEKSMILKINRNVDELPMRSLMNPFNSKTLNEKLFTFSTSDTIGMYKHWITEKNLRKKDQIFTSQDINLIRSSIIWINWYMFDQALQKQSTRPLNLDFCVSQDALAVHAIEGLDGLYRIAKYNKRELKILFEMLSDEPPARASFLSAASNQLNELVNYRMKEVRINNLFRCYEYFTVAHKSIHKLRRMPSYYMYNPNLLKTQKYLGMLFQIGYNRMQNLKFLHSKNKASVTNKRLYELLDKNFSTFEA